MKLAGQSLASSRLFWLATGPYYQHCYYDVGFQTHQLNLTYKL